MMHLCWLFPSTGKFQFVQFLYGADNLSSEKWEMRDLELYGLTNAEKYMLLAFEIGLAL